MKCVLCNGLLEEKIIEHQELGIALGKFKAHICKECGEAYFDSETVDKIQKRSKERGLFGLASKRTRVAQIGNSLAIRIPKDLASFVDLKKEQEVRIIPKSKNEILLEVD
ncbi:MAG TPA: hypothetical protein VJJ75_02905 [Candidatus Nanoarchaeia archaeon]|nr:hypothetical protein [Candidatus Nanoarchaeia archaeon]